jgi:formylglycine-generating enzyme required for sulfatase activity
MIPQEELLSKPIKLRNACIFYLGHIPTFLDIHLTRVTTGIPTEPSYYPQIFERGIDPDVDNPELCHSHSEIPESWPPVQEIVGFQERVRNRVRQQYATEASQMNHSLKRALWMGFEHEAMHLETFLYMLLQSDKSLLPPGVDPPDFAAMANQAETHSVTNEWITVPGQEISIGHDDPEDDIETDRIFGWDNERPKRSAVVASFQAKARPIINREYARYLEETKKQKTPASWVYEPPVIGTAETSNSTDGPDGRANGESAIQNYLTGRYVRTFFGKVPLAQALHWPTVTSYDELEGCAKWMNGRIPTANEVRSIYAFVERSRSSDEEPSTVNR